MGAKEEEEGSWFCMILKTLFACHFPLFWTFFFSGTHTFPVSFIIFFSSPYSTHTCCTFMWSSDAHTPFWRAIVWNISYTNIFPSDKKQEEELRKEADPKHHHLKEDLHVEITAYAAAPEAYARIAKALVEVKRFLVPVSKHHILLQLKLLSLICDPERLFVSYSELQ